MHRHDNHVVEIEAVSHRYGEADVYALKDLSLNVPAGSFTCVIGPSGCGKTTLLSILGGLLTPDVGTVIVNGKTLVESGRRLERESARIGYVFQDHRLLPWRTVGQNIEIVLDAAGIPKSEWNARTETYLEMLRIGRFRGSWPLQLSGGQRQRAAIARALAIDPELILMDEPFSTLDEVTARFLRRELVDLWLRSGSTVVFVTHSVREAVYLADEVIVLTNGPGTVAHRLPIKLDRPRGYEDAALARIEGQLIATVLDAWGYREGEDYG